MAVSTRTYDKKLYKKCIKCRCWHPREDIVDEHDGHIKKRRFGRNEQSSDGLQSICYSCKNVSNTLARSKNATQRIRHHTGTRCLTQLGKSAPREFVKNMEDYLGYKITTLVKALGKDLKSREGSKRKLRDALNEGYHIDHITPLSSFGVVGDDGTVDWDVFRKCWSVDNLRAIPAEENLAKGASHVSEHVEEAGGISDDVTAASSDVEAQTQKADEADEEGSSEIVAGVGP